MNCIFHIGSKEAELVCIELENESGKIKQIEQIITQKMKREIIIDNVTEKKYCKKSKYDRWLTNDIHLIFNIFFHLSFYNFLNVSLA